MSKKSTTIIGGFIGTVFEVARLPFSVLHMVFSNTKECFGGAKSKVHDWNDNIRNYSIKNDLDK